MGSKDETRTKVDDKSIR